MIYKCKITVRYAETDRMGVSHHAMYPIWFEEARSRWIAANGISYAEIEKRGILLPIIDLHCHYYGTSDYMDPLWIHTQITKLTAARIIFHYNVYKQNQLITAGSTTHAWVDSVAFRPINIKKTAPDLYDLMQHGIQDPSIQQ